jgi:hypothetical protein
LDMAQTIPAREGRSTHRQRGSMLSSPTRQSGLEQAGQSLASTQHERDAQSYRVGVGFAPAPKVHLSTQVAGESREELPTERKVTEHKVAKGQHVLASINAEDILHTQSIAPKKSLPTHVKPGKAFVGTATGSSSGEVTVPLVQSPPGAGAESLSEGTFGLPTSEVVSPSTQSLRTRGEQGAKPASPSVGNPTSPIQTLLPQEGRRTTNVGAQFIAPSTLTPLVDEAASHKTSTNNLPMKAVHDHVGMTSSQATAPANESTTSTPTIKVTIGRIEVRAVPSAPAPASPRPRPARPGPAISLNDYLNQYNGRQR